MNTQVIGNDFAKIIIRVLNLLGLKLQDAIDRREELRTRRRAERQMRHMDARLLRDIGYDHVSHSAKTHAQH